MPAGPSLALGPAVATPGEPMPRDRRLTSREREVLLLIAEGCTSREIAGRLQISPKTVETFRAILLGKTRAKNSVQLVLKAQALGWLDLLSTPHAEG